MKFLLPIDEELTPETLETFAACEQAVGFTPNIVRMLGYSPAALSSFLALFGNQSRGVFSDREREAIYLPVAQLSGSSYCIAAHTQWIKNAGLTEADAVELRHGRHSDPVLGFLARFALAVAETGGRVDPDLMDEFEGRGYGAAALLDLIALVAEVKFSNLIGVMMRPPIDFEQVVELPSR